MSEYLHVGNPYLDQLSTLGGMVTDQGQGMIFLDFATSAARLSCLFGFSGLCGSFGSMHKTNKTNQTNQPTKQTRETRQTPPLPSAPQTTNTPSAIFPHLTVGQTTQNPELITQNFPKWAGCFLVGESVSFGPIVEWKPSLAWVFSDGTSREVCDLRMNV